MESIISLRSNIDFFRFFCKQTAEVNTSNTPTTACPASSSVLTCYWIWLTALSTCTAHAKLDHSTFLIPVFLSFHDNLLDSVHILLELGIGWLGISCSSMGCLETSCLGTSFVSLGILYKSLGFSCTPASSCSFSIPQPSPSEFKGTLQEPTAVRVALSLLVPFIFPVHKTCMT